MNVAFCPSALVDQALEVLFQALPQTPSARHQTALRSLLEAFEKGLTGRLANGFHLSSLDPGMGKSTAVTSFLKAWKAAGFTPSGSALLAVASIKEIQDYVDRAGLSAPDLAVLTADKDANGLGCPEDQHHQAPILITTQQMVRKRTRNRSFADMPAFQFHGARRSLVVWDESLDLEEWRVVRLDEIAALPRAFRSRDPDYVKMAEALWESLRVHEGGPVVIPENLKTSSWKGTDRDTASTVKKLNGMAGQQAFLHRHDNGDHILVEDNASLPDDLSPLVILDASGRVRETYRLWSKHRRNLHRLPEAPRDYGDLTVHVWQRASGKVTQADENKRNDIAREVVAKIREREGDWLLVHHKGLEALVKEIKDRVEPGLSDRIGAIHWGMHRASNDHRDIDQIAALGLLHYSPGTYFALACAAIGAVPQDLADLRLEDVRWGELQHHLLQAVCRSAIRKGEGKPCHAFVVCSPSPKAHTRIQATFPGAKVVDWELDKVNLDDMQKAAIDYLRERFADQDVQRVPKQEVRERIGARQDHFARDILAARDFGEALDHYGLAMSHHAFIRSPDYCRPDW